MPAGPARIEVWKGFEYRPQVYRVRTTPGAKPDVNVSIERAVPMAARGWYSGDSHLHFIRASDADEKTIFDLLTDEARLIFAQIEKAAGEKRQSQYIDGKDAPG